MPFSLVGDHKKEAFDPDSGVSLRSCGARGPEIERQIWSVDFSGRQFEFETYVLAEQRDGRRDVLLSPSQKFIEYIDDDAAHCHEDRMALLRKIVEGLYFIFPTYFSAPIRFRKSYPVKAQIIGEGVRFSAIHASLWDAVELGPPD